MRILGGLAVAVLSAGVLAPACAPHATSLNVPVLGPAPMRPGASTWFVNGATGSDHNDGRTASTAFATIRRATTNNALNGGDTILVAPGLYAETVLLTTSGTPAGYTTLMGMPGMARPQIVSSPSIYYPASPQSGSTISIRASYARVSGFDVTWQHNPTMPNAFGAGISLCCALNIPVGTIPGPVQHHVDIDNNTVHDIDGAGMSINRGDYIRILHNTVYNNAKLAPNETSGIGLGYSIDFDHAPGYHTVVAFNTSYANVNLVNAQYQTPAGQSESSNCTTDGNGIIVDSNNGSQTNGVPYQSYTLIFGNLTFGNGGRGITIYNSDHVGVIANTSYNDLSSPLMCQRASQGALESDKSTYVSFYNNAVTPPAAALPAVDVGTTGDTWQNNLLGAAIKHTSSSSLSISAQFNDAAPAFRNATPNLQSADFRLAPGSTGAAAGMPYSNAETAIDGNTVQANAPVAVGALFAN